jgi:dTDP-4-amino-4,6-dideoxy-D-galactose acyltransferase
MVEPFEAAACTVLPWDSQFFGHKIARLAGARLTRARADEARAFCSRNGVACLYFLASADDPATLALAGEAGFRLVDVRVTFGRDCGADDADLASTSAIRPAASSDHAELRRLAEGAHTGTRFFADERLAPRAPALYGRWLERSLDDAAGAVFVATLDDAPVGYLTCAVDPATQVGNIGLVAVADRAQARGLGTALLRAGLGWLARAGASRTTVVTQGRNLPAQVLYERAGFVTQAVELWFHLWL